MGESQEAGGRSRAQSRMRSTPSESCHAKMAGLRILGIVVDGRLAVLSLLGCRGRHHRMRRPSHALRPSRSVDWEEGHNVELA